MNRKVIEFRRLNALLFLIGLLCLCSSAQAQTQILELRNIINAGAGILIGVHGENLNRTLDYAIRFRISCSYRDAQGKQQTWQRSDTPFPRSVVDATLHYPRNSNAPADTILYCAFSFASPSEIDTPVPLPRFTDFQKYTIEITYGPRAAAGNPRPIDETKIEKVIRVGGVVLLPVVVVPGIFSPDFPGTQKGDGGGGGSFPDLEDFLVIQSRTNSKPNAGNRLVSSGFSIRNYDTPMGNRADKQGKEDFFSDGIPIYTLAYPTSSASFQSASDKLKALIDQVKADTYADKVQVITHSKGGLVARYYVTDPNNPNNYKNVFQMLVCECPNTGSIWARYSNLQNLRFGNVDLKNLYPTWTYYQARGETKYVKVENSQLRKLNERSIPTSIPYTLFVNSVQRTQVAFAGAASILERDTYYYGMGDGIVPDFSQVGREADANNGQLSDPIKAFADATDQTKYKSNIRFVSPDVPVFPDPGFPQNQIPSSDGHTKYLTQTSVLKELYNRVVPTEMQLP